MIELKNVCKTYNLNKKNPTKALKDISVSFRDNEFVSIIGPSGCGKTTLLNLIGGLDKPNSGDILLDGNHISKFNEKKMNSYRANKVGIIFQNYNLIAQETLLGNVELALAIKGISKKKRREKALAALAMVGLEELAYKKSNEISGGQAQRVAIARALVTEPDIILADEPTGALDEIASKQILDLLKELSKNHLVIHVTHNKELAFRYSNRIIEIENGIILSDSNEYKKTKIDDFKFRNSKLKIINSFMLSIKNLLLKKRRTIMTIIASTISILCLSTVFSISTSVNKYVKEVESNITSGTSIELSNNTVDYLKVVNDLSFSDKYKISKSTGKVNVFEMSKKIRTLYDDLNDSLNLKNNLPDNYINYIKNMDKSSNTGILFDSGMSLEYSMYTNFKGSNGNSIKSVECIRKIYQNILSQTELDNIASFLSTYSTSFMQLTPDYDFINSEYDVVKGRLPQNKNELLLVLDGNSTATDLLLGTLGFYSQDEFLEVINAVINDNKEYKTEFSYEEIIGHEFYWQKNDSIFIENINPYTSNLDVLQPYFYIPEISNTSEALKLEVVGIIDVKEEYNGSIRSGFYYTDELKDYIYSQNIDSSICKFIKDVSSQSSNQYPYVKYDCIYSGTIPINNINVNVGITYKFDYFYNGTLYNDVIGFCGGDYLTAIVNTSSSAIIGSDLLNLSSVSLSNLGGDKSIKKIIIYSIDSSERRIINDYLYKWNSEDDIELNSINLKAEDRSYVSINDSSLIVMSIINSVKNVINIALYTFSIIALLISSIMIFIVTYISVLDRTKEIGILRTLGARKMDVSGLFIIENFIIGLISSILGLLICLCIILPCKTIIYDNYSFVLEIIPFGYNFLIIFISILISILSGLIPTIEAMGIAPSKVLKSE